MKQYQLVTSSVAVGNSESNTVVSRSFELTNNRLNIAFEVTASGVSGTGAVVKLQAAYTDTAGHYVDVDATNAKVTLTGNGRFPLAVSVQNSNFAADMPLPPFIRFVCTTGGSDAATIDGIKLIA